MVILNILYSTRLLASHDIIINIIEGMVTYMHLLTCSKILINSSHKMNIATRIHVGRVYFNSIIITIYHNRTDIKIAVHLYN